MSERSFSINIRPGIPHLLIYLGIGALFHAVFVGSQFDWSSAWTWGWLLGWPIMLFAAFWAVVLVVVVVVLLVAGVAALIGHPL